MKVRAFPWQWLTHRAGTFVLQKWVLPGVICQVQQPPDVQVALVEVSSLFSTCLTFQVELWVCKQTNKQ